MSINVTRAHLKHALDSANYDLLDKLLEHDATCINDTSLYTDTWGTWWGLLINAISMDSIDGVKILLKHGANREIGTWGDCIPTSPLEFAAEHPEILPLLESPERPMWKRQSDPPLPEETDADRAVNRQGEIRDHTGLAFQIPE